MKKYDIKKNAINNYLNNDKAYIKVLLNNKNDVFDLMDPRKKTISSDLANYITNKSKEIPFKYKIVIEMFTDDISDEDKNNLKEIINSYYGFKMEEKKKIIMSNVYKSLLLVLFGALLLSIVIFMPNMVGPLFNEIVCVIGWVLIWEGTETCLLSNSSEKTKYNNYKQLYNAKIIFSDKLEIKD